MPERWKYELTLNFALPQGAKIIGSTTFEIITDKQLSTAEKQNVGALFRIANEKRIEAP